MLLPWKRSIRGRNWDGSRSCFFVDLDGGIIWDIRRRKDFLPRCRTIFFGAGTATSLRKIIPAASWRKGILFVQVAENRKASDVVDPYRHSPFTTNLPAGRSPAAFFYSFMEYQ